MRRALLPALLLVATACAKRPPMGDPALHQALSLKALEQSEAVSDCLRKDGQRANLSAIVVAMAGEVKEAKVTTTAGQANPATICMETAITRWRLDDGLSGQASLILADDSADQDARTAKAEVAKMVDSHESGLGACQDVAGDRGDGTLPSGLILLTWSIEKRRAKNIKVASNDTGDPEFANCILAEVESWNFPPDALGDVEFPFEFTGTGQNL